MMEKTSPRLSVYIMQIQVDRPESQTPVPDLTLKTQMWGAFQISDQGHSDGEVSANILKSREF